MLKIENNCVNCAKYSFCKMAQKAKVVVWKNCGQFKPSVDATKKARKEQAKTRNFIYR